MGLQKPPARDRDEREGGPPFCEHCFFQNFQVCTALKETHQPVTLRIFLFFHPKLSSVYGPKRDAATCHVKDSPDLNQCLQNERPLPFISISCGAFTCRHAQLCKMSSNTCKMSSNACKMSSNACKMSSNACEMSSNACKWL